MIDMKAMLADREAGTQGPWATSGYDVYSILNPDYDLVLAYVETNEANARRIARVPELEQALIDARGSLVAVEARSKVAYLAGYYQAECGLPSEPLGNDSTTITAQLMEERDHARAALVKVAEMLDDEFPRYVENNGYALPTDELIAICKKGLGE